MTMECKRIVDGASPLPLLVGAEAWFSISVKTIKLASGVHACISPGTKGWLPSFSIAGYAIACQSCGSYGMELNRVEERKRRL